MCLALDQKGSIGVENKLNIVKYYKESDYHSLYNIRSNKLRSNNMINGGRFFYRGLLVMVLSIIFVSLLSFVLMRLSPIDPATAYVMRSSAIVTQEQIEEARVLLGMDQPMMIQYFIWLKDVTKGEFGRSLSNGLPVSKLLLDAVPVSLMVVGLATVIMVIGVVVFGCLQYYFEGTFLEKLLQTISIVAIAVPPFFIPVVFVSNVAFKFEHLAITGNVGVMRYLPSAMCLAVSGIGFYSQLLNKRLIEEMRKEYILFAKCRGLSDIRLIFYHALPSAVIDLVPNFAQMIGLCLAGAAVVERVFSLPGFGYLIIESVLKRDAPVIHGSVFVLATILVILNFIAEMLQRFLSGGKNVNEGVG